LSVVKSMARAAAGQHSGRLVKQKKINVLVRYVPDRPRTWTRLSLTPSISSAMRAKADYRIFSRAPAQLGKPIIANKAGSGRPRQAACKMLSPKAVADPELLAEAQSLRLDISPKTRPRPQRS